MSADPAIAARPSAIDVERLDDGALVVLTINRPHRRNALDSQTLAELHRLLDTLNGDPAARAVVLTGAGSAFCAGADIKAQPDDLIDAAATPQTALQAAATSTGGITFAAQERMLPGRVFDAPEAAAIGLVLGVVDDNELRATAVAKAREIACHSPLAVW